ncbi:MAG: hypothetical protein V3V08_14350 [Nannocystaceae bacterium]
MKTATCTFLFAAIGLASCLSDESSRAHGPQSTTDVETTDIETADIETAEVEVPAAHSEHDFVPVAWDQQLEASLRTAPHDESRREALRARLSVMKTHIQALRRAVSAGTDDQANVPEPALDAVSTHEENLRTNLKALERAKGVLQRKLDALGQPSLGSSTPRSSGPPR